MDFNASGKAWPFFQVSGKVLAYFGAISVDSWGDFQHFYVISKKFTACLHNFLLFSATLHYFTIFSLVFLIFDFIIIYLNRGLKGPSLGSQSGSQGSWLPWGPF